MASAAVRERRAAADQPSFGKMAAAATKFPNWDPTAYERLKKLSPSIAKCAKDLAEFLVLKEQRPKLYKRGDDVGV